MKKEQIIDLERILDYEWDGESEITCKPDIDFIVIYYILSKSHSFKLYTSQCKSNAGFVHLMDWLKKYDLVFEGGLIFKDHGTKDSRDLLDGLSSMGCHIN